MVRKPSVLIVDGSEETREVLATALERRGLQILATSGAEQGLQLARRHRPDLIVLDVEIEEPDEATACAPLAAQSEVNRTPLVVIGSARRACCGPHVGEFVSKPYHYAPLIRKIESLLEGTARPKGRSA